MREREISMFERNIGWLPLARPQLGIPPTTQLNQQSPGPQAGTQSTEPHRPGPNYYFLNNVQLLFKFLFVGFF